MYGECQRIMKQNGDSVLLWYQLHLLQCLGVFHTGGNEVDASGFNAAVAQYIGKTRHIPADFIERSGEQMA